MLLSRSGFTLRCPPDGRTRRCAAERSFAGVAWQLGSRSPRPWRGERDAKARSTVPVQLCREATMPERRGASRRVVVILGGAVVLSAMVLAVTWGFFGARRGNPGASASGAA